ncbi:hypothetical protein [Companilactobacillus insicii]|nr:hypothetical protein [Companilactobacillus insicii]
MENIKTSNIYIDEIIKKNKKEALDVILGRPNVVEALKKLSVQ